MTELVQPSGPRNASGALELVQPSGPGNASGALDLVQPSGPGNASSALERRKVFVETWGCQMNELDGRRFVGLMRNAGWGEAQAPEEADLILLNTCSIRDKAEQKVYDRLGRLAVLKRQKPSLRMGVCGCVAQQEGQKLLDRLPYVDFVVGTGRIEALPAIVRRVEEEDDRPCEIGFDLDEVAYTPSAIAREVAYKAKITVIEGCNKNCTFCVVPFTRGRERSRRLRDVVEETLRLVDEGTFEVELLGQTVNAYRDPETGEDFADLLRAVARIPGLRRLRFVTSHPRNFSQKLIETMASEDTICPALHLPVQSGSDQVLRRMKRQYDRAFYEELVQSLRQAMPGLALSTDVIVGFPGESEADFESTLDLLRSVRFASVYSFVYSPRPRTAAGRWEHDVPPAEASSRLTRLMDLQQTIQRELHRELEGLNLEVLIDGRDRKDQRASGRSACNRVVNVDAPHRNLPPGAFVTTRIERAFPNSLLGVPA